MKIHKYVILFLLLIFLTTACHGVSSALNKPKSADDFDITVLKSPVDFNQNGKDDYEDFLIGVGKKSYAMEFQKQLKISVFL